MANRSNLAYDFSVYEPKKKADPVNEPATGAKAKTAAQPAQEPARPSETRRRRISMEKNPMPMARKESAFKFAFRAFIFLAVFCAVLYGKVETNSLFRDINALEKELKSLQTENITLAAEYEARTSLKNVEDYAENVLGLKKLDKAQIEYVELPGESVIEIVEAENKNIFVRIRNFINEMREHIGA